MAQAIHAEHSAPGADPLRKLVYIGLGLGLALVAASTAITLGGRAIGERIALSGHSGATRAVTVTLGPDRLSLPENTIRFARQRVDGPAERIDLALTWPGLEGYSAGRRALFNAADRPGQLIFVSLSQSVMSRDMSGRVGPIYSHLFDGQPEAYAHGLTLNRLSTAAGYRDEVLLTAENGTAAPYAVRCILPARADQATNADCQRDIALGRDLSVQYRFSATLLGEWKTIDAAVRAYVGGRLSPEIAPDAPGGSLKKHGNAGSNYSS